jgi:hypothetical protein
VLGVKVLLALKKVELVAVSMVVGNAEVLIGAGAVVIG